MYQVGCAGLYPGKNCQQILADIAAGRVRSVVDFGGDSLNIIACPSCSRVENEAFIELAAKVKQMTEYAHDHAITIAVMGCRVNGPGETDDADLGLWCGPNYVNLKRGPESLGAYPYDEILGSSRDLDETGHPFYDHRVDRVHDLAAAIVRNRPKKLEYN